MSKRKRYVIYKEFWLGRKPKKWLEFSDFDEAQAALGRLSASPSGKYFNYLLVDTEALGEGR